MNDARGDSPCIDVCRIDEIAAWGALDPATRRDILDRLPERWNQVVGPVRESRR